MTNDIPKEYSQAWVDEQLAAGKTPQEIEELLNKAWDSPESDAEKHARRMRDEDEKSYRDRGY